MDAEYGEVETSGNIAGKSFYDFRLLDAVAGADNDTFRYGEITVPVGFVYTYNDGKGFHVRIPYTPDMRRLTVRLVMESGSGGTEYLRNPATGKHWFPVVAETEAGTADIALAAFFSLNEKGVYNLLSRDGYLAVYSGSETDFEIGAAKERDVSAESFSRKSLPTFYDRCRPRRLPAFESGKQRSCRQTAVGIPVGQGRHQECLYGFCHGRAAFRNRGKGGERWVSTGS
mgnify:CR=1 FL=1